MSIELLQTLSIVSYIVAALCFLAAIALFFLLDIPKVFGEISGVSEKKAIEQIRVQNESSTNHLGKNGSGNKDRENLTDKINKAGNVVHGENNIESIGSTEKFSTKDLVPQSQETTILSSAGETTVLNDTSETLFGETTVLTTAFNDDNYSVDVEIGFSASDEIIE